VGAGVPNNTQPVCTVPRRTNFTRDPQPLGTDRHQPIWTALCLEWPRSTWRIMTVRSARRRSSLQYQPNTPTPLQHQRGSPDAVRCSSDTRRPAETALSWRCVSSRRGSRRPSANSPTVRTSTPIDAGITLTTAWTVSVGLTAVSRTDPSARYTIGMSTNNPGWRRQPEPLVCPVPSSLARRGRRTPPTRLIVRVPVPSRVRTVPVRTALRAP